MRFRAFASIVAALIMCGYSGYSRANTPPGADAFIRSAEVVLAGQGPEASVLPASDPRVRALLQASSGRAVFGTAPSSAQDLTWLLKVRKPLAEIVQRYLDDGVAAGAEPTSAQRMANTSKHAEVVYPLLILTIYAAAHELSAIADALPSRAESERGPMIAEAVALRHGEISMFTGALMMSAGAGGMGEYHEAMFTALADSASSVASALNLQQRRELFVWVLRLPAQGVTPEQAEYRQLEQAFKSRDCSGLCVYND